MAGIDMARLTAASSVKSSSVKKVSASSASAKETAKSDFASMMQGKADKAASGEQKKDAPVKGQDKDANGKPVGKEDKKDTVPVKEEADPSKTMQELQATLGQMMVQAAGEEAAGTPEVELVLEGQPEAVDVAEGLQAVQQAQTGVSEKVIPEALPETETQPITEAVQPMPEAQDILSAQPHAAAAGQNRPEQPAEEKAVKAEPAAVKEKSEEDFRPQEVSADRGQDTEKTDIAPQVRAQADSQEDRAGQDGRTQEAEVQKMAASDMTAGRPQAAFDVGEIPQEKAQTLKTSPDTLGYDLGNRLASSLPKSNGTLTIELEPASLGKLTIRVVYEAGKAAVSILSANPKTVELLSQRAGEIARILEEKTGQETVVYTPEQKSPYDESQAGQERQQQRQESREQQNKKNQSESFTQMLRLGLV